MVLSFYFNNLWASFCNISIAWSFASNFCQVTRSFCLTSLALSTEICQRFSVSTFICIDFYPPTSWAWSSVSFGRGLWSSTAMVSLCKRNIGCLEILILVVEDQSNGVASCDDGMGVLCGWESLLSEYESVDWSCNGCKGAGTQELCTCRKINQEVPLLFGNIPHLYNL